MLPASKYKVKTIVGSAVCSAADIAALYLWDIFEALEERIMKTMT